MYEFRGKHYLASLKECGMDLKDIRVLKEGVRHAILESGATILSCHDHTFEGDGYTVVFVLSESHCSLHTYPEYGHLFLDYFTCGDSCCIETFHQHIVRLFAPKTQEFQILHRA